MLLVLVLAAGGSGCASTGIAPRPYPGAPAPPGPDAGRVPSATPAAPTPVAEAAVGIAQTLLGTRYRSGGADPGGFDCSGFVQYVFSRAGVSLPRSVREQWQAGVDVPATDVRPGDLLFFATQGGEVSHVGIAIGDDAFIHAPSARGVVRIERWSADYWARRYAGARRVE